MKYIKLFEDYDELRSDTKKLSESEFIHLFKEKCSEYDFNSKLLIDRIVSLDRSNFYLIDPMKYTRTSISGIPNVYTLLMDNEEIWNEYPKRSNSLICYLRAVSQPHSDFLIIPYNGANIGVCNKVDDIWGIWNERSAKMLEMTNSSFLNYLQFVWNSKHKTLLNKENYLILKEQLKEVEEILMNENVLYNNEWTKSASEIKLNILRRAIIKYQGLHNLLLNLYSPNKNFSHYNSNHIDNISTKKTFKNYEYETWSTRVECWTDSKCLLVPRQLYNNVKSKLKNN